MSREEKRRKFHEALLNMLYPPPPHLQEDEDEPVNILREGVDVNRIPDVDDLEGSSSSTSGDGGECGPQKLTRAQRKRLRKKKLKEGVSSRRKIIGPLLPSTSDDGNGGGGGALENEPPGVRNNASEELDTGIDKPGEPSACTNQNKVKHRRMAKRLAKERLKSSNMKNCHQDDCPSGKDGSFA